MAVEKSYARLGLVPRHRDRRGPRDGAALHPADAEPRGHRARHLYAGERHRPRHLEPGALPRRAVGRVSNLQVEPGGRTIEIDFELFTDRLTTVGANVDHPPGLADGGHVRAAARSGGEQPRDRRGLPLSRHAGESPSADDARLHAKIGRTSRRCRRRWRSYGIGCPKCWSASSRRSRSSGDRRQDARQPRPGRPVLHQRRTHRPRERPAGAERRLAEVLRDDQHADRADRLETWTDWSARRARCRSSPTRHAPPSTRQTCPASIAAPRARPWTRPRWRRRTCGARCPRYASRSSSCASSRASCRNSRSRWSTARGHRAKR